MIPGNLSLNPHASVFNPIDAPSVKAPWGMISKNVILLWIEVASFDEGNRIVIPHVLENREPSYKVYQKVSSATFWGFPLNKIRP